MRVINKIKFEYGKKKNQRYEKKCQERLVNDSFSIICSNCIGGLIYHRLHKEFLSPTINLWMDQKDFLKMVLDLERYMSIELRFIDGENEYPTAMLNDVKIHFNHYKTEDEARDSWNRRKKRINYDNLYIIMYDRDGLTKTDLEKLSTVKCKNRIILSDKEYPEIDYVKTLVPNSNATHGALFLDTDSFGMKSFEKQWDFVAWLNN